MPSLEWEPRGRDKTHEGHKGQIWRVTSIKSERQEGWTSPGQWGGLAPMRGEKWWGKWGRRVNMVQTLCTHACKCENDTCWNYSRTWGQGGIKENGGGVNSSMIYLIYCKNFCKWHNVPQPSITVKVKKKKKRVLKADKGMWEGHSRHSKEHGP
jgi:hypothetical protein